MTRARARRLTGAGGAEAHRDVPDADLDARRVLREHLYRQRLEVLAGTPQQPAVRQGDPGVVVVPGQHRGDVVEYGGGAFLARALGGTEAMPGVDGRALHRLENRNPVTGGVLDRWVMDARDAASADRVRRAGLDVTVTDLVMRDPDVTAAFVRHGVDQLPTGSAPAA